MFVQSVTCCCQQKPTSQHCWVRCCPSELRQLQMKNLKTEPMVTVVLFRPELQQQQLCAGWIFLKTRVYWCNQGWRWGGENHSSTKILFWIYPPQVFVGAFESCLQLGSFRWWWKAPQIGLEWEFYIISIIPSKKNSQLQPSYVYLLTQPLQHN